jgi:hypothetical protein
MLLFNNVMYVSSYNIKHDRLPFSLILLYILLNLKDVMCKNIRLFKIKQAGLNNKIVVFDVTEDKKT